MRVPVYLDNRTHMFALQKNHIVLIGQRMLSDFQHSHCALRMAGLMMRNSM